MASLPQGSGLVTLLIDRVRLDISDDSASPSFTDTQIKDFLYKASTWLNAELNTVIDPSGTSTPIYCWDTTNMVFTNNMQDIHAAMIVMAVECLIAKRRFFSAVNRGIRIQDGDIEVDTTIGFGGFKSLIGDPKFGVCARLDKLIEKFNRDMAGAAIYGTEIWHGNRRKYEYRENDGGIEFLPHFDDYFTNLEDYFR